MTFDHFYIVGCRKQLFTMYLNGSVFPKSIKVLFSEFVYRSEIYVVSPAPHF